MGPFGVGLGWLLAGCVPSMPGYEKVDNPGHDFDGDGVSENENDCDDQDPLGFPGAGERCDGSDNDCDGFIDEDAVDTVVWYYDEDNDGYGKDAIAQAACDAPTPKYVTVGGDCDDTRDDVHPTADEFCDTRDNDCDGFTDENDAVDATTWYADSDGDGYADDSRPFTSCIAPSGYIGSTDPDCDDGRPTVHPGATEDCLTAHDEDCDGVVDEENADNCTNYYMDDDGDTYGVGSPSCLCAASGNLRATALGDCDDSDAATNPGALNCGLRGELDVATAFAFFASGWPTEAGDFNGDGYLDLLDSNGNYSGSFSAQGAVYLYLGPISATPIMADWTLLGAAPSDNLGSEEFRLVDHDCDGDMELLVQTDSSSGVLSIESTAISLPSVATDHSLVSAVTSTTGTIRSFGDLDGDYCGDFLSTTVHYGASSGQVSSTWSVSQEFLAKDVTGDGTVDLLEVPLEGEAVVQVFEGSGGRELVAPAADGDITFSTSEFPTLWVEVRVRPAGDANNDGYQDFLLLSPWAGSVPNPFTGTPDTQIGRVWLFPGSSAGAGAWSNENDATAVYSGESRGDRFGWDAAVGDFDGDGSIDLVAASMNGPNPEGGCLFYGPMGGSMSTSDADAWGGLYGQAGVRQGLDGGPYDFNFDGYDELWVGGYLFYGQP